jgi:DNA mismatch endonuclease (patch repair protein)
MAHTHTPEVRSYNMSRIRSKDTTPEITVRRFLFSKGFRYRIHDKKLPGHPDIVMKKYRTCIFVHGCFWHAHRSCKYFKVPKSNKDYWKTKLKRNKARDAKHVKELMKLDWNVLIIWECELKLSPDVSLQKLFSGLTDRKVLKRNFVAS